MTFEKLDKKRSELLTNHLIKFDGGWVNEGRANKVYEVKRHILEGFRVGLVLPSADYYDLSTLWKLSTTDYIGLIPTNDNSFYEIICGIKGDGILAYPMVGDRYVMRLEEPNMLPTPGDTTYSSWPGLRTHLGCFTEKEIPFDEGLLRIYTVKKQNPPVLRLYNNDLWQNYAKVVLNLGVNRCEIFEVPNPTPEQLAKAHLITHWTNYSTGWGK